MLASTGDRQRLGLRALDQPKIELGEPAVLFAELLFFGFPVADLCEGAGVGRDLLTQSTRSGRGRFDQVMGAL
jgi:hypothetical protein